MKAANGLATVAIIAALSSVSAGCEPSYVESGPYPLDRVPVGSSDNPYRPVFHLDHSILPNGAVKTAVLVVWRAPDGTDSPAWFQEKFVVVDLDQSCDDPEVSFVFRDGKECADISANPQFYHSRLYVSDCLERVRISCCRADLPDGINVLGR